MDQVKHLGYIGGALLTTWINLLQNLLSPNLWLRGLTQFAGRKNENQHHSVSTKSGMSLRFGVSHGIAPWDLARKGWFEKHAKDHPGVFA